MSQTRGNPDTKVEIEGFEARHYDALMNLASFGTYPRFLRRVVRDMDIRPNDAILDLGSGTGRNAVRMHRHLSSQGRIVGLDTGEEMLEQARRRCRNLPNVTMEKKRIEQPLEYGEEFDIVFISFVLHGFYQEDRLRIVENAHRVLRAGGRFLILDYDEFEPEQTSLPVRLFFRHVECRLATDFVRRHWQDVLAERGFANFQARKYYRGHVRLLQAEKNESSRV
jgi:ubiquinone/menaquinone biosynthesis C-methylase UbiE